MRFDSRVWKLDLDNLWWNKNRIDCRDSILAHFKAGRGPAHLTGNKGCGKSTLAAYLSEKLPAPVFRMRGHDHEDLTHDFSDSAIIIIDEAQKISQEERSKIRKQNPRVLMVSVVDLSDDGYKLVRKIEPLTEKEVVSYVNYQGALDEFDDDALKELYKASKGHMRLINTICKTALEQPELIITKEVLRYVAMKRFKLRY